MTLSQHRILLRGRVPGAKVSVGDNTIVDLILNNAVIDIAAYTACLKANKKFNVVADNSEYNLSSVIGNFLCVDKSGLWWNAGTASSPNWRQLNPSTMKGFDVNWPNWRDLDSDNPQDYNVEGDVLKTVPTPDTSLTDGFWLFYGKKPAAMTQDGHYPFSGSTTEFTHLSIFDEAIQLYARWKIVPLINQKADEDKLHRDYLAEREEKYNLFQRRLDITASDDCRLQGPQVR